jgi:putative membrane protein
MTIALAAVFEILEWLAAIYSDPSAGASYLGAQGDEFDAVKDVGLAALGAAITMTSLAVARRFGVRAPRPPPSE